MIDPLSSDHTVYGFETISKTEKTVRIRRLFSEVASRYDVMNDIMSFRMHHQWKTTMVSLLESPGKTLLDVAGGTGDIAERYLQASKRFKRTPVITVCDLNPDMLRYGIDRLLNKGITHGIQWVTGNAEALPIADESIDYYTIAFGIRNVADIPRALKEAHRVLKPGGKFVCMEFSKVTAPLLAKIYDTYSFHIIPKIGAWITGDASAYQYLVESIRTFPEQQQFLRMIEQAGFKRARYQNLSAGIVAIHSGWKI